MTRARPLSRFYEVKSRHLEVNELRINAVGIALLITLTLGMLDHVTGSTVLGLKGPSDEQRARAALAQKFAPLPDSGASVAKQTAFDAAKGTARCSNC